MKNVRILVLESSTTSAKAMLYSPEEGVLAIHITPYAARYNHDGIQDADMRPATPVYSWSYTGAAAFTRGLRRDKAYALDYHRRSGCMPHVTYTPFKLRYLSGEGLSLEGKFCCEQSAYIYYHLTGSPVSSPSLISGGGLINPGTKDYDERTRKELGLGRAQLPELCNYWETVPLSASGSALLGLASGIPVLPPCPTVPSTRCARVLYAPVAWPPSPWGPAPPCASPPRLPSSPTHRAPGAISPPVPIGSADPRPPGPATAWTGLWSTSSPPSTEAFGRMKPNAVLVNTARGGIVDEEALYTALKKRKIAAAALDAMVFEPPCDSPLLTLDNFIATSHLGATTYDAVHKMSMMAAENLIQRLETGTCDHAL